MLYVRSLGLTLLALILLFCPGCNAIREEAKTARLAEEAEQTKVVYKEVHDHHVTFHPGHDKEATKNPKKKAPPPTLKVTPLASVAPSPTSVPEPSAAASGDAIVGLPSPTATEPSPTITAASPSPTSVPAATPSPTNPLAAPSPKTSDPVKLAEYLADNMPPDARIHWVGKQVTLKLAAAWDPERFLLLRPERATVSTVIIYRRDGQAYRLTLPNWTISIQYLDERGKITKTIGLSEPINAEDPDPK